ncbi:MAG: pyridoxal phosphate-dependent aminotransferase family protein [Spirochaetia bacterium]|nr:pyridoxal phosphate-dependent aminotransferase family protein [Spirochaetia bacterium]
MPDILSYIENSLKKKKDDNSLRKLYLTKGKIDFCSNDYLGFAQDKKLYKLFKKKLSSTDEILFGSTGSRLLSGQSEYVQTLEFKLADFFKSESALVFNSGYHANIGLVPSLIKKSDTIFYDALCHASIRDGILLSKAESYSFKHNDMIDLIEKIKRNGKGNIFIITEALFSMDGDYSPIEEITKICEKYNAALILDEAHSTGTIGKEGRGLAVSMNQQGNIFARIHTFGKAMGCFGAVILCNNTLKTYLINNARSFIFTTALPLFNIAAIDCSLDYLKMSSERIDTLHKNIIYFLQNIPSSLRKYFIPSASPIQGFITPGNENIKKLASYLQNNNIDARAILHPSVPRGKERIRIILHSFNTHEEIRKLLQNINDYVTM